MIVCLSPNGPMVHHGEAPLRVMVATIDGVAVLEREAPDCAWELSSRHLSGRHISALLHEPVHADIYAATHGDGIYRSRDGGATWHACAEGLTRSNVFSLATVVRDGRAVVLAGTEPVSLFASEDRGDTWVERPSIGMHPGREKWTFPVPPHDAHLKAIALDPRDPDAFFACIEQGALLKTEDGGRNWREISSYFKDSDKWYRDIHKVVPSQTNPERVLMTTGMGVYRSADGGETWVQLTDLDFDIRYPDHLVVAPDADETIFLAGAGQSPDNWRNTNFAGASVRLSRDGGDSWEDASAGLGPSERPAIEAMSIAHHDGGYTLFLGNTDGDVFVRDGRADSWTCIWRGLGAVSKVGHYRHVQAPSAQADEVA